MKSPERRKGGLGNGICGGSCVMWSFILFWSLAAIYVIKHNILKNKTSFVHDGENEHEFSSSITMLNQKNHPNRLVSGSSTTSSSSSSSFRGHQPVDQYFHIVFSTDCSFYQDWQTLLVFYTASVVKQQGMITRIASGCKEDKQKELIDLYKKLFPKYEVHFTPDFKEDVKTGKKYDFYNKPYGLQHWLNETRPKPNKEEIIVLIDPDMIFLRPLTFNVKDNPANIYMPGIDANSAEVPERYGRGHPVAQLYGLEAPWTNDRNRNFNRTYVCGKGSPCLKVEKQFGCDHFSVGPPYIVEREDLIRITNTWTDFVPRVYSNYPELLAEMFAYSMAAAHNELPHLTLMNYMVSNTDMNEEGWKFIDSLESNVCVPPTNGIFYPGKILPTVLHFCQFYRCDVFGFQKRRIPKYLFSCDYPLLRELPRNLGNSTFKNRDGEIIKLTTIKARRDAFMLCTIYQSINALLLYYKLRMCQPPKQKINSEKVINVVELKF